MIGSGAVAKFVDLVLVAVVFAAAIIIYRFIVDVLVSASAVMNLGGLLNLVAKHCLLDMFSIPIYRTTSAKPQQN